MDQDVNTIKSLLNTSFLSGSNKEPINKIPVNQLIFGDSEKQAKKKESHKNALFSFDHIVARIASEFDSQFNLVEQLNTGRRKEVVERICRLAGTDASVPLRSIIKAEPDSDLLKARKQFAYEMALFQLMQYIVLKKWQDAAGLNAKTIERNASSLNFQIANVLKIAMPNRKLPTQAWAFLRQNIYGWHKLSSDTLQHLNLHYKSRLEKSVEPFLQWMGEYLNCQATWNHAENLTAYNYLSDCVNTLYARKRFDRIFLYGLSNGLVLPRARMRMRGSESQVFFAEDQLELYLSELLMLMLTDKPQNSTIIALKEKLFEKETVHTRDLFPENRHFLADGADLLFYLPSQKLPEETELNDIALLFRHLNEGGLLAIGSQSYWPLEDTEIASFLRTECLKSMSLKVIFDLRHLVNKANGVELPNCWYLFEKVSSKELRDESRPHIVKAIGCVENKDEIQLLWESVKDLLQSEADSNEISQAVVATPHPIRLERMQAATQQGNLNHAPWTSLTEPAYYEISSKLKRAKDKITNCGTFVHPQSPVGGGDFNMPMYRSTCLVEIPGVSIFAYNPESYDQSKHAEIVFDRYRKFHSQIFVPDVSTFESANFMTALINSSPIQFWYNLEWEQQQAQMTNRSRKRSPFLKLMPAYRLLKEAVQNDDPVEIQPEQLPEVRQHFYTLYAENQLSQTYSLIVSLEEFIHKHLKTIRDCANLLYEDFSIYRWSLPQSLPELSFNRVLPALEHLQKVSLFEHPAFHIISLKACGDFVIRDVTFDVNSYGADLFVHNQNEPVVTIKGEETVLLWLKSQIDHCIGKSWVGAGRQVQMPIDVAIMKSQIAEFIKMTEYELTSTREACAILDEIFCALFGLSIEGSHNHANFIRSYLSPSHVAINLDTGSAIPMLRPL